MSDVLSAASLLLAVIGLLYSAWYSELREALAVQVRPHVDDRKPEIAQVQNASSKALPLFLGGLVMTAVLTPVFCAAVRATIEAAREPASHYDAVVAMFAAIYVTTGFMTLHLGKMFVRLRGVLSKLRS
jgi:hypothetical protein